jgi:UDP:flavonoid glycosyltransferase YjiC (YdhE family)
VPLVVVPLFADQPHNARRVHELGAGVALPAFATMRAALEHGPEALAPLAGAVRRVLADPAYRRVVGRVAAEARALAPAEAAVRLLEQIASPRSEAVPVAA